MCRPILFVTLLQIGLSLRDRPSLLITRVVTGRMGLHSVLLLLQIVEQALNISFVKLKLGQSQNRDGQKNLTIVYLY